MAWNDKIIAYFIGGFVLLLIGQVVGRAWSDAEWQRVISHLSDRCESEFAGVNKKLNEGTHNGR